MSHRRLRLGVPQLVMTRFVGGRELWPLMGLIINLRRADRRFKSLVANDAG
ncbi:MAG TPA: hypothetical protein VHS58_21505 [Acetobacteraceae bacterium]|jgi:hypothetical protein|nr:hypothetical protein [Acetobacteraceae bacterium]